MDLWETRHFATLAGWKSVEGDSGKRELGGGAREREVLTFLAPWIPPIWACVGLMAYRAMSCLSCWDWDQDSQGGQELVLCV